MEPDKLADEMQRQYDRCKEFPETKEGGWIAMIMLRNLAPRAIELLRTFKPRAVTRDTARPAWEPRPPAPRPASQEPPTLPGASTDPAGSD